MLRRNNAVPHVDGQRQELVEVLLGGVGLDS